MNEPLIAIFGMAAVTYLTRSSGFWLMNRISISPKVEKWLSFVPGSIFSAIVAPSALLSGIDDGIGTLVVLVMMLWSRNLMLSIISGAGLVWILRNLQ